MRGVEHEAGRKSIAVVGSHSPARSLAMALLLDECIQRHGWSERLSVAAVGLGDGAGRASSGEVDAITASGLRVADAECPDIEQHPALVTDATCLVVGSEAEAELFVQWPGADGKQVLAFVDFVSGDTSAIDNPEADFAVFCEEVADAAGLLLRSLVARYP